MRSEAPVRARSGWWRQESEFLSSGDRACAVFQAGYIPSLRDRLDEKRLSGSATAFAACHFVRFGYIARNVSAQRRASLARYTRPPRMGATPHNSPTGAAATSALNV